MMWSDRGDPAPAETPAPRWISALVAGVVIAWYLVTEPRAAWSAGRQVWREFRADGDA